LANITIEDPQRRTVISGEGKFVWTMTNPKFTLFEVFFRFSLLILTLIALLYFGFKLRNRHPTSWSIEQGFLFYFIVLLYKFNPKILF